MIYVMSDLHGCYDKLIKMLKLIQFTDNDELYILGDMVDRGEDGLKIVDFVSACKIFIVCAETTIIRQKFFCPLI